MATATEPNGVLDAPPPEIKEGGEDLDVFLTAANTGLDVWKGVGLDSRRSTLDQQGFDIADQQEASMRARKNLAEQTKKFKKSTPEEKLTLVGALLKAYQEEIDRLTKRGKSAEASFLTLYKSLYDAPDPVPMLQQAISHCRTLQNVLPDKERAEQALADLQADVGDIRNQEVTVRELESALAQSRAEVEALKTQVEDSVRQGVEQQTEAFMASQQELVQEYQETERALSAQLKDAQDALVVVQARNDTYQAQLLDAKSARDEQEQALTHEAEMLAADLETANARIAAMQEELSNATNAAKNAARQDVLDSEAAAADEQAQLRSELQAKDLSLTRAEDRVTELEAQLVDSGTALRIFQQKMDAADLQNSERIASLEEELDGRPTMESVMAMRKELVSLKALQFNIIADESGEDGDDGDLGSLLAENSLEALLTMKNQKLESEVTTLRRQVATLTSDLTSSKAQLSEEAKSSEQLRTLVAKLEGDLANVDTRRSAGAATPLDSAQPSDPFGQLEAPGAAVGSAAVPNAPGAVVTPAPDPFQSVAEQAAPSADTARFDIVCEQRDRFRRRVTTLEEENGRLQEEMKRVSMEVKSLRTDNLSLYEKIRYLENYRNNISSSVSSRDPESGGHGAEDRYEEIYEEKMNPFTEFNKRERERRYGNLNAAERITLSGSRFFLSNKYSRMFLFGYSLFLHVMVFFVLYRWTHDSHGCWEKGHGDHISYHDT